MNFTSAGNMNLNKKMHKVAEHIHDEFPGKAYYLLVFDRGNEKQADYISNCSRESMVEAMKETASRLSEKEVRIYKCDGGFELRVPEKEYKEKIQDMWDNPSKYCEYANGSDHAYYGFLKFIYVSIDGKELRLVDIVETGA